MTLAPVIDGVNERPTNDVYIVLCTFGGTCATISKYQTKIGDYFYYGKLVFSTRTRIEFVQGTTALTVSAAKQYCERYCVPVLHGKDAVAVYMGLVTFMSHDDG